MLVRAQQETAGGRAVMMDGSLCGTMDEEIDRWEMQTEGHTEADVSCCAPGQSESDGKVGGLMKDIDRDIDAIPQMCVRDCCCFKKINIIFGVDTMD